MIICKSYAVKGLVLGVVLFLFYELYDPQADIKVYIHASVYLERSIRKIYIKHVYIY